MAHTTTYFCDVCGKKILPSKMSPWDNLSVTIVGEDILENLDLCSWLCLKQFVDKKLED